MFCVRDKFSFFGVKKIATLRSKYSFRQFAAVLRATAYMAAIEGLQKGERITIRASDNSIEELHSPFLSLQNSYGTTMHVWVTLGDELLHFEIEEKFYQNTNHRTRIRYYPSVVYDQTKEKIETWWGTEHPVDQAATREQEKMEAKKIECFIEKLMEVHEVRPIPRFSLNMVA